MLTSIFTQLVLARTATISKMLGRIETILRIAHNDSSKGNDRIPSKTILLNITYRDHSDMNFKIEATQ